MRDRIASSSAITPDAGGIAPELRLSSASAARRGVRCRRIQAQLGAMSADRRAAWRKNAIDAVGVHDSASARQPASLPLQARGAVNVLRGRRWRDIENRPVHVEQNGTWQIASVRRHSRIRRFCLMHLARNDRCATLLHAHGGNCIVRQC